MLDYGAGATWHKFDLTNQDSTFPDLSARVLYHTAGIGAVLPWLEKVRAAGVSRLIAFSSTSLFTKAASTSDTDREMIAKLELYEQTFVTKCEDLGLAWTIFRPTMIYGGKFGDRTVMDIARVIRRFGFFPILGFGKGLRQPVHAEDLATACLRAFGRQVTFNKAYNVGGAERLPYREMVERIFLAMDKKPRFLPVPLAGFELAVFLANYHPRYRHLTSSMAKRMDQDMIFSIDDAVSDFEYKPRAFAPKF
jgi:nucleoside-diphosphate-sugar epimerase